LTLKTFWFTISLGLTPMILTDPRLHYQFTDYGILIPIRTTKITKVLERLDELPALNGRDWKITRISEPVDRAALERVHDPRYVERLYGPGLESEILSAYELVDAEGNHHRYAPESAIKPMSRFFDDVVLLHVAGTTQTCRLALDRGWAFFTGGGMHHAHRDRGTGFCLVNDLVIAVRTLQTEGRVRQVWIIDVDAHKGDGTASVTAGDDTILTLSIHMAQGWPLDPETTRERGPDNPSQIPSDIDIGQEPGEDGFYLARLSAGLEQLKETAQTKHGRLPDLVLVVDGADPYEKDELPSTSSMKLTLAQLLERDLLIDRFLTKLHLPAAWLNAGGYGDHVWAVYTQFLEKVLPEKVKERVV
jgi:acetoin utilization deacetylase AcuC-like enzyme